MWVALAIILPLCLTFLTIAGLAFYSYAEPRAVRNAKARAQVETINTRIEKERWIQDWIVDQRRDGQPPALPPGTVEVMPPPPQKRRHQMSWPEDD